MKYTVSLLQEIDFAPSTEVAEILQNVRTILSTLRGSVPLDRDFGLTWNYVDKPIAEVKMLHIAAVIEAIEDYEPRARVQSIEFGDSMTDAMEGLLNCRVVVSIGEEEIEEEW